MNSDPNQDNLSATLEEPQQNDVNEIPSPAESGSTEIPDSLSPSPASSLPEKGIQTNHIGTPGDEVVDFDWQKQQTRHDSFAGGINSAFQWNQVFRHKLSEFPQNLKEQLFSPDFPEDWQKEDIAGDISSQWVSENMPGVVAHPDDVEEYWESVREELSESFSVPNTNEGIYEEIARRNQNFTSSIEQLESMRKQAVSNALKGVKNDSIRESWQQTLNELPEELKDKSENILHSLEKEAALQSSRIKPLYDSVRQVVKRMDKMETPGFTPLFPEGARVFPGKPTFPIPTGMSAMNGAIPEVFNVNKRLRQLSRADRTLLFEMVEEHIIEERERAAENKSPEEADELMPLISRGTLRSSMKPLYGAANALGGYLAFMSDLTGKAVEWTGLDDELADFLKKDARAIREDISQAHRMRQIMETRHAPLKPHEDGRGAPPNLHWLKQCFVGFSEEAVAVTLALVAPTSLIGYGAAQSGNHYATSETNHQKKHDEKGETETEESPVLTQANRILASVASAGLQTLIEANAYGKTFKPLIAAFPKASKAIAIGARPYVEQKGIALAQPLGESVGNYATELATRGMDAEFDGEQLSKTLGTLESNVMDYVATLPFVLLAAGKVKLTDFRKQSAMINDPKLVSYYKIPADTLSTIRKTKDPEQQGILLQKALRESPVWDSPEVLHQSAEVMNAAEFSSDAAGQWHKYSAESLGELLEMPQEKISEIISRKGIPSTPGVTQPVYSPNPKAAVTPLEKMQSIWHAKANLPSLEPQVVGEKAVWKLKFTDDLPETHPGYVLKGETFNSPEDALVAWRDEINTNTMFHRHNALNRAKGEDADMLNDVYFANETEKEQAIKSVIDELKTIAPQSTLLRSNLSSEMAQNSSRSLKRQATREQEKINAHTIEDALLYHSDSPAEEIATNRVVRMWLDELNSGRISPREATAWIEHWEKQSGELLLFLVPESLSPRLQHRHLAGKLTDLTLNKSGSDTLELLPPSFTEPARLVQEQLSHAATLADLLPRTANFSTHLKTTESAHQALSQTLSGYLDQPWSVTQKHVSRLSRADGSLPKGTPPELPRDLVQDIKWLHDQGMSPLFSVTDPKTNMSKWVSRFPDGSYSQKHSSPQEALLEWSEKSRKIKPGDLKQMGGEATQSLMEFYNSPQNSTGRISYQTEEVSSSAIDTSLPRSNERMNIFFRQNPHMEGIKDLKFVEGGSNVATMSPLGHITHKVKVRDLSDPLAIIEENAEAAWSGQFRKGSLTMEQAKEELIKLGKTTGESYLPADINTKSPDAQLQNVIEGLSQASREYMLGQHSNELLPQAARQWINHTFASPYKVPHAIPMLRRSTSMKKAEAEGNLSPSFLEMLQESIGVNRHIHQERLLMSNSLPQRELILPLLKRPGELFDSLPGSARENLILNWQKLTGSKNPLPPQQTILSIESGIKKNPDILNWDYDPSQKRFVHSENWGKNSSSHLVSEKQLPQNLQSEEALNTIKSYSLLRRSLDNSPYTSPEGIRWGKKLFSASAKDRPGNLPSKWSVEESPQEYGLRYSSPDNPGHVVRLSGGNLYNAHKESRFPYVRHTCNGHYLNEKGEITTPFSPDSYIPLEKFNHSSIKKDPRLAVPPKLEQSLDIFTKKNELESLLKDKSGKGMTTCRDLIFHLKESSRHSNLDARQSELMNTILTEIQKLPEHPSVPEHSLDTAVKAARELMQTTGIQTIN